MILVNVFPDDNFLNARPFVTKHVLCCIIESQSIVQKIVVVSLRSSDSEG